MENTNSNFTSADALKVIIAFVIFFGGIIALELIFG